MTNEKYMKSLQACNRIELSRLSKGRSQDFTLGPQKLSAESKRIEAPIGVRIGRGCPLANRLRVWCRQN